jgi:hypothetical protein
LQIEKFRFKKFNLKSSPTYLKSFLIPLLSLKGRGGMGGYEPKD